MKKLPLTVTALSFAISYSAWGALPIIQDPTEVYIPLMPDGGYLTLEANFLHPQENHGLGDYAVVNNQIKNIDPGFDWGWAATVGFIFPETGNDVALSYKRLETRDSINEIGNNFTPVNFPVAFTFNFVGEPPSGATFNIVNAHATQEFDLNQVDLTVGQFINVGYGLQLHPRIGLRFADIEHDLLSNYNGIGTAFESVGLLVTAPFSPSIQSHEESEYQGVGPLAGIDGSYPIGYGFDIVGHFSSSLLLGNINSKLDGNVSVPSTTFFNEGVPVSLFLVGLNSGPNISSASTRRLVTNLEAKLGLDYTYPFNNPQTNLTLEVGYQVSHYFNAIDLIKTSGNAIITDSDTEISTGIPSVLVTGPVTHTSADFGFYGPYVSLTVHV